MEEFIYRWQELFGAIIGAALPFVFWFMTRGIESYYKNKENLLYLEKIIVSNINNVLDIEVTIKKFLDNQLKTLEGNVRKHLASNPYSYSADMAFFPLFATNLIEENYLKVSSRSSFLDNKLLQVFKMSKDFAHSIEDFRLQFKETLQSNKDMILNKSNPPLIQNTMYLTNLEAFKEAVERDLLNGNVKTYLNLLTRTYVALMEINRLGIYCWRYKFSPSFRYFKNYKELKEFKKGMFERVEDYIKPIVEEKLKNFSEKKTS